MYRGRLPKSVRSLLAPFLALNVSLSLALALAPAARAQQSEPLPTVGVFADAGDPAGMELLSQLRDAIKRSGFYPSTNAEQALVGVHLLTVEPRPGTQPSTTVYSAAWTGRDGRFLTHTVGTCSLPTAADCANTLMVTTSQLARMQQSGEANRRRE